MKTWVQKIKDWLDPPVIKPPKPEDGSIWELLILLKSGEMYSLEFTDRHHYRKYWNEWETYKARDTAISYINGTTPMILNGEGNLRITRDQIYSYELCEMKKDEPAVEEGVPE